MYTIMKISKSKLAQIIKEEIVRFNKINLLEGKKKQIQEELSKLNENRDIENMDVELEKEYFQKEMKKFALSRKHSTISGKDIVQKI